MLTILDNLLDRLTMYQLTLYVLLSYISISIALSLFGLLSYNPLHILLTFLLLIGVMWVANKLCGLIFKAPLNVESVYITASILTLILSPVATLKDAEMVAATGLLAILSKFILSIGKKHIFNPAAVAVVLSGFVFQYFASWWVGTAVLFPFTLVGGLLVMRKVQRGRMVSVFFLVAGIVAILLGLQSGISPLESLRSFFLDSAAVFFATIMLTEPLTSPGRQNLRAVYAGIVAFFFAPQLRIGQIEATPELALVIGNIFSYLVSPKIKLMLHLKEKISVADQIDFVFDKPQHISFAAGQYMEWTLPHLATDLRGNRRYFTLASSPTEDTIRIGVKFYHPGSSFKKALTSLSSSQVITASSLSGEFMLPKDKDKKLAFLAGGIGITPFRSMVKFLLDTEEKRDMVLLYSNKIEAEIMYKDVFTEGQAVGLRAIYTLTNTDTLPKNWKGNTGRIDSSMIAKEIPDFKSRVFYLSGPHAMVVAFEQVLYGMNIPRSHIKKDFFPGF